MILSSIFMTTSPIMSSVLLNDAFPFCVPASCKINSIQFDSVFTVRCIVIMYTYCYMILYHHDYPSTWGLFRLTPINQLTFLMVDTPPDLLNMIDTALEYIVDVWLRT